MALLRVVNYNDLRVMADLAESNIAKVKSGDKVKVLFKPQQRNYATVSYAKPMPSTHDPYRVEVKITFNQRDYYSQYDFAGTYQHTNLRH